ncbi:MAG: hypothetical protein GX945_06090 [Lentisphaerae bacterium]|nr:hypothetical protein [Lentisphaerota bacterium]
MSTPAEITNLISNISPKNIEAFCRLKFSSYDFERTQTNEGYFGIDYSEAKVDPNYRSAVRQFIDATKDGMVKVIGKFKERDSSQEPIYVYSVPMKGAITSRSSKKKQADFARHLLKVAQYDLARYAQFKPGWDTGCIRSLLFFHDDEGNFRLSLIDSDNNIFRRFTYFVEHDTTGTKNRTFRYRMTNTDNEKAVKGEVQKWEKYDDIKEAFSVKELTKEFYNELFAWYERAVASPDVIFPSDTAKRKESETEPVFRERVKSEQVIRLITRLLFVWFIKQKKLVPDELFDPRELGKILKSFSENEGDNYYRAILQNLFFATLNSEIGSRDFAANGSWDDNREHFDIKTLYRYQEEFAIPKADVLTRFRSIPFLNGGLFECLDRGRDYFDGFSRNKDKVAHVPNAFFFDDNEKALGLIPLLERYNFTIDENAHDDEDIALDPELLGKVFENLLGAFNPETSSTARKASGSFYTRREIVNYMVDESLIAYLLTKLQGDDGKQDDAQRVQDEKVLRELFNDGIRPPDEMLCQTLDKALTTAKILDPACGSGAFPMGMLLRMVELLRVLRQIPDDESLYELKLELIENCIYGVDIQCIAVQISKLRFFISLVCEQTPTDAPETNFGINPLPNLETKFVAADSLIGLPNMKAEFPGFDTANIGQLKEDLWDIRHRHFQARNYRDKKILRQEDADKRKEIKEALTKAIAPNFETLAQLEAERAKVAAPDWQIRDKRQDNNYLITELASEVRENTNVQYDANADRRKILDEKIKKEKKKQSTPSTQIDAITRQLTEWNPYDQNASSPYFDPEWMFNVTEGFDIVIGNPPYGAKTNKEAVQKYGYQLFCAETAILFIERGQKLLNTNGVECYIIPKAFCYASNYRRTRDYVAPHLMLLVDCGKAFENVKLEACIFLVRLGKIRENYRNTLYDGVGFNEMGLIPLFVKDVFGLLPNGLNKKSIEIGLKSIRTGQFLGKFVKNKRGEPFQQMLTKTGDYAVIGGKEINKYGICGIKGWISKNIMRTENGFISSKSLLVQNIVAHIKKPYPQIKIIACIPDRDDCVITDTINQLFITHDDISQKELWALLNSKFICWFAYHFLYGLAIRTMHFDSVITDRIPIAKGLSGQKQIPVLVDRILSAKKANPSADTSELEAEIDQIVYRLYGLTPEEIAIVENATAKAPTKSGKKEHKGAAVPAKGAAAGGKATKSATAAAAPSKKPAASRRGRPPRQEPGIEI